MSPRFGSSGPEVSEKLTNIVEFLQLDTSQTQLRNDFQQLKFSMDTLSTILEKRYTEMMNLDTIHRKIRSATADFHVLADSLKRDIKLHQDGNNIFTFHPKQRFWFKNFVFVELHRAVDRIAASAIASCEEADEQICDAFHNHSENLEAAPCGTTLCGMGWSCQNSKITNPLPEATEGNKKIRSLLDIYGLRSLHPTSLPELENKETKTN